MTPRSTILQPIFPKKFVNGQTQWVVYLITCECSAFYVGKTFIEFWRRIHDHIYAIEIGDLYFPIGRHAADDYACYPFKVPFLALEHILQDPRGGDWDRCILQRKMRWIHSLRATFAPGLNDATSFKSFLPL